MKQRNGALYVPQGIKCPVYSIAFHFLLQWDLTSLSIEGKSKIHQAMIHKCNSIFLLPVTENREWLRKQIVPHGEANCVLVLALLLTNSPKPSEPLGSYMSGFCHGHWDISEWEIMEEVKYIWGPLHLSLHCETVK